MPLLPGAVGGSDLLQASRANAARTINFFPETIRGQGAKTDKWLKPTPGMIPFATIVGADGAVRGEFQQDGRMFTVVGTGFYEVFTDGSYTKYGTVTDDGGYASFASNGTAGFQVMVVVTGLGYIFDLLANTFTAITDPDFITFPRMVDFMDGYFIVSQTNTRAFQISALEDGTSWDALDVAERSEGSDSLVALIRSHREIWLLGSKTSEVWYDNGDALFPFAPVQGVFIEHGAAAPFAVIRINETLIWLEVSELGNGTVVMANGFNPSQISTYTIALEIQQGFDLTACVGWGYQEDGHSFYVLLTPGATSPFDTSKCLDLTEGEWHERATWNATTCRWEQHRGRCHAFCFGKHLVGDRLTGTIYDMSTAYFDETLVVP